MITANEARKKIDALETERGKKQMQIAEERITEAVEKGYSDCWLGIYVSDATESWLKSLGYEIERTFSPKDGDDTKVKW